MTEEEFEVRLRRAQSNLRIAQMGKGEEIFLEDLVANIQKFTPLGCF